MNIVAQKLLTLLSAGLGRAHRRHNRAYIIGVAERQRLSLGITKPRLSYNLPAFILFHGLRHTPWSIGTLHTWAM